MEQTKPLNEYENPIIVFDDNLATSISKNKCQFFISGSKKLDIYIIYHTPTWFTKKKDEEY